MGELVTLDPDKLPKMKSWFGKVTCPSSGDSCAEKMEGSLAEALVSIFHPKDFVYAGLEFGTVPLLQVLDAIRADKWLYLKGEVNSALGKKIKSHVRDTFYCSDEGWKQMIWDRSLEVFNLAKQNIGQN